MKQQRNFPGTRIPWFRMNACIKLALHYYFNANSKSEFEHILNNSTGFSLSERRVLKKHFEDQIYPVDKNLAEWMWSLGGERYCFKTLLTELRLTHTITKKKNAKSKNKIQ